MPRLLLDNSEMPDAVWRNITIEPWSGDVRMKLRPYTQALHDLVEQRAKAHPFSRRHERTIDGVTKTVDPDTETRAEARHEEFLKVIIGDEWEGIEGDPPCDNEHKVIIRGIPNLLLFLYTKTSQMAGIVLKDEEKN